MVLVLGPPTSPPIKLILAQVGMMGDFGIIIIITHHTLWNHHRVRMIQLVLLLVLHLVLHMVTVKVVWVLGPPAIPNRNLIVGLMGVILCCLIVDIIQP